MRGSWIVLASNRRRWGSTPARRRPLEMVSVAAGRQAEIALVLRMRLGRPVQQQHLSRRSSYHAAGLNTARSSQSCPAWADKIGFSAKRFSFISNKSSDFAHHTSLGRVIREDTTRTASGQQPRTTRTRHRGRVRRYSPKRLSAISDRSRLARVVGGWARSLCLPDRLETVPRTCRRAICHRGRRQHNRQRFGYDSLMNR